MKIKIINQEALENLISNNEETGNEDILACDGGCSCDTGSDWVNQTCMAPEWVVGWKKATC